MVVFIDIETYSAAKLRETGLYKYVEDPSFEVLCIGYAADNNPVKTISIAAGETLPTWLVGWLTDPRIKKIAHNAQFEQVALDRWLGVKTGPWLCSMAKSAYCGHPLALDAVCKALQVDQHEAKLNGKALIKYFCEPCKPTKTNGGRTRNLPQHDVERWDAFIDYLVGDVKACRAIWRRLEGYKVPELEQLVYEVDQKINARGVAVDVPFVQAAVAVDTAVRSALVERCAAVTGLDNPNSVAQLKGWLLDNTGDTVGSLNKEALQGLKAMHAEDKVVAEVLSLRERMGKTSVKKYQAILNAVCADGRVRGIHQYYGAFRTGRWAGRLVQPQNMPRNHAKHLEAIRADVATGDADLCELLHGGEVQDLLSQLIRTAFVAPDGKMLAPSDFSAIEARVLAWLAGEHWRLDVFATHGKIYEASASQMFGVPIESIGKGSDLRQRGKVAELALGYQGGWQALDAMGGSKLGLTEAQMRETVTLWRAANPAIVKFWNTLERCAVAAIKSKGREVKAGKSPVVFVADDFALRVQLPSGRELFYPSAELNTNRWDKISIRYMGVEEQTKRWAWIETYGGKLTENLVQAVARDLLAEALVRLDAAGVDVCMHVHDEVVPEIPADNAEGHAAMVDAIMAEPPSWAEGLPLNADGFVTKFYKKD